MYIDRNSSFVSVRTGLNIGRKFRQTGDSYNGIEEKLSGSVQKDVYEAGDAFETTSAYDRYKYSYKQQMEDDYQKELMEVQINDVNKYKKMLADRESSGKKSFRQIEQMAAENGGYAVYNGVTMHLDPLYKQMSIGDMSEGRIINVGMLSNGYNLRLNRDNIDDVKRLLDILPPEDLKKIMEAITVDTMKMKSEEDGEDEKAKVGLSQEEREVREAQKEKFS